ncbi:MAG: hypothetical protein LBH28_03720 [Oscillospiraceae bacterium]|nr:hypothetical protein [Oscillospiraceae bacterium]
MTHSAAFPVTALLIPVLWILASNRLSAFFVVLSYHLAISRGLAPGALVFLPETHTLMDACALWLLMGIGVSIPFLIFWRRNKHKKALCLLIAIMLAYFLPPISLIGVVNPMIATACIFPGWGWRGLSTMLVIYSLCAIDKRMTWAFTIIVAALPIIGAAGLKIPDNPPGFFAINTSFGRLGSGSYDFENDYKRAQMIFNDIRNVHPRDLESEEYIVLPETIAGRLNNTGIYLWRTELKKILRADQKAIFGGEIPTDDGRKYDNAIIMLDGENTITVAQRIPVPYSMYRGPLAEEGANLHLFENGILALPDGRKAALIICYEAFLTLPYILSFLQNPDLIIWTGNQWWCKDTSLPLIQERYAALWAQLFGVPALFARNR